jgi:glutamine synthetase adenylyltransferase
MYYGNDDISIKSINPITPPASTSSRVGNSVILEVFYELQFSISNLLQRIKTQDEESIFESLRSLLHSCRSVTNQLETAREGADQESFDNAKKAFSETLEEVVLQTRTYVTVRDNVSVDELEETTRELTRIAEDLIEIVYGREIEENFFSQRNVLVVNEELISAFENSIANVIKCVWSVALS